MIVKERRRGVIARSAFTLMEMLVVVSIIVMLAGLGGYYFIQTQRNSQVKGAEIQARTLIDACEKYAVNNQSIYPTALTDLLTTQAGGPYLKHQDALLDPWNQPYQYQEPIPGQSTQPHVWTTSPFDGAIIGNPPQ